MAIPGFVQTSLTRLASYFNSSVATPANPGGFDGDGHVVNFPLALQDVAAVGQYVAEAADRFADAVAAIEAGPVTSVNGMSGAVVLPEVPKVLPPIVTAPAQGSTPSLTGGALLLSVDRLTSLYGEAQKTIRFRIATAASFAANTIVYDTGVLTQTGVSASLANAQATLTGGTTYYLRAIQTDAKDVSSGWSAPVSFTFPRLPVAPVMSAPANGATNVGAQNQAVTFTASAYSHPNGTAQAARRFELSKDNFATIVTVNGAVGQASATLASPKDSLSANTVYKVRCVDTDTNGGVSPGAATSFTTATVFRPDLGSPYQGGFFAGQTDDGKDIVLADRSTAAAGSWSYANQSANDLVSNGFTDWALGARAIMARVSSNLRGLALFQVGGAQAFESTPWWTSEVYSDSDFVQRANLIRMTTGEYVNGERADSTNYTSRAIRLVTPT
ncbi:Ig-like domain-containing protein [Aureimonas jatrophae]|uniref:Ig-like domain-containing protein n=1 Tax=Aureimonas jatrophae TaxID=1166073 RepID=A0A1H0H076_9HYPH|nr:Ig-like domain-containing protein [Aureimonas jatrophae]MBB3949901.1 hypothetical protein [Aureimonas jatrophae]SDO12462.1 hypothetical protein SAMN05192530_103448 [Aureimonas jatrophae]